MHRTISNVCAVLLGALVFLSVPPLAQGQSINSWKDTYGTSPSEFTNAEWASIIDAAWGEGASIESKLALFDSWWNELNLRYGGFHNHDTDLDALRDKYRLEVAEGVSHGRFSGIMTHMTYQLEELHTYLFDRTVRNSPMRKGVPMMVIGQYGNNNRFGALLTPLPDSTLLVYEVLPNHRLGLQRGDKVLGYDGVLWKDLYPKLIEAELPLFVNPVNGSTPESNYYYAMHAAGLNWHLFDTIDIVQFATGDTLHFNTNLLVNENRTLWGKEQIAPPGTRWPNRSAGQRIGWSLIEDTKIGFVTVTSWSFDAQFDIRAQFEQAVNEFMNTEGIEGMIFDFRYNTGGGALAREGLQLLFNDTVPTVGFDRRVPGSADPLAMEPDPQRFEFNLVIRGDPNTFFDKPIAILIGPGSISAGELEARRMSFHPRARIFGLPAPGGNTGSDFINIGSTDWFVSRAHSTQYLVSTREYLTHIGLQPDERVWFTQEDAANGVDTVIKAAMDWINAEATATEDVVRGNPSITVESYPNPFRARTTFHLNLPAPGPVEFVIYDMLGRQVSTLHDEYLQSGQYRMHWDGQNDQGTRVAPGVYFWRIHSGSSQLSGQIIAR